VSRTRRPSRPSGEPGIQARKPTSWEVACKAAGYHVFGYRAIGHTLMMPVVPFRLQSATATKPLPEAGLLDTGSDTTAFPQWVRIALRIPESECVQRPSNTAGGAGTDLVHPTSIRLTVHGVEISVPAVFCDADYPLLGRADFLARFHVRLNETDKRFALKPRKDMSRREYARWVSASKSIRASP
jgi:hypothetical protein